MAKGQDEPWLEYEKRPLPRGFTHPLQQTDVREALVSAGVAIGRFARSGSAGQDWWDMEVVVLHAHRYGDAVVFDWGRTTPWRRSAWPYLAAPAVCGVRYGRPCSGPACRESSNGSGRCKTEARHGA